MKCNYDCFHCKFPDCRSKCNRITPWESKVMHGAHGGWEMDMIADRITRLMRCGMHQPEIAAAMNISPRKYKAAQDLIARKKDADKRLQSA